MLQLFRNYSPFTVLILLIASFVMKLQALSVPVAPQVMDGHILFDGIISLLDYFLGGSAFAYTLLTVFMLFGQALFLNYITVRHKLFPRNTYLPAFAYLLVTSLFPGFNYFSEPLLINWFTLIAVNIMLTFSQTTQPRKQIFNAGFAICLPALFQFPAIGFLLLLILSLVFLRSFNVGEWVVALVGYLTPVYFFAGILFLVDRLDLFTQIVHIGFSVPGKLQPVYTIAGLTGLGFLLIAGSIGVQQQISKMTIYIRRAWGLVYTYLFVSTTVAFIALSPVKAAWIIVMPASSLVIAYAFSFEKNKRFSNFAFYFSLFLLIFCQLALNK